LQRCHALDQRDDVLMNNINAYRMTVSSFSEMHNGKPTRLAK